MAHTAAVAGSPSVPAPLPMRQVAVAIGAARMDQALAALRAAAAEADLAEVRLDRFEEPYDLAALLRLPGRVPLIATLRPLDQGGRCGDPPAARLEVLRQAAALGAEYVDLEWDATTPRAVADLHAEGARVIVSRHDFAAMPPDLAEVWPASLAASGADVVKVAGMARTPADCLVALRALRAADRPAVAIAMGEAGLASRLLALREPRCFLTFVAPSGAGSATAPGQPRAEDLRAVYHAHRLGSATRIYGLLVPRLAPDLVARVNGLLEASREDAVALPFVAPARGAVAAIEALRPLPVAGWHVAAPAARAALGAWLGRSGAETAGTTHPSGVVFSAEGEPRGTWAATLEEEVERWLAR